MRYQWYRKKISPFIEMQDMVSSKERRVFENALFEEFSPVLNKSCYALNLISEYAEIVFIFNSE